MRFFLVLLPLVFPWSSFAQPGTLDPTFGNGGVVHLDPSEVFDEAMSVVALPNNSVLLAGSTWYAPFFQPDTICGMIIKLQEDGSLDATFGIGGYRPVLGGERNGLNGMAVTQAGIYVVGWSLSEYVVGVPDPDTQVMLARLTMTGELDPGFGTAGIVLTNIGFNGDVAADLAMQPDGKIVVAGSTQDANGVNNALLLRYNADGTLDETFSGDGRLIITAWPEEDKFEDVAVLDDGSIVGVGRVGYDPAATAMLVKVDASGSFDTAFGTNGTLMPDFGWLHSRADAVLAQGNDMLVCGSRDSSSADPEALVARFHGDGSFDAAFGSGGIAVVVGSDKSSALDLAIQSDGRLLIGGKASLEPYLTYMLARFNTDGSMDQSFGTDGIVLTAIPPADSEVRSIAIRPDGRILAAGMCNGTYSDIAVARYLWSDCAVFPTITPEAITLCPNSTGELATGPFDSYQWYKNGAEIPGATGQALTLTSADDVGSWFKVRTTVDTCFGFSDSVLVVGYVFLPPFIINEGDAPNLIGDNGEQIYCQGDDPVLSLGAPYDTNVQWSNNGEPIPGANDPSYPVTGPGSYTVEGAPAACPDFIQSPGVEVVMEFHPYIQPMIQDTGILLCPEPEGLSAQWYYNGSPVAGLGQCVIPIDAGNYTVFVDYGDSCSVLSAPFMVIGIREHTTEKLSAAPVPTEGPVTISWTGGRLPPWRLADATGRIARSGLAASPPLSLDLSDLEPGRYHFLVSDGRSLGLSVAR